MKLFKLFVTFLFLLSLTYAAFAQQLITSVPVGTFPQGVVVDRLKNLVYVVNGNTSFVTRTTNVSIIDGATNTPIRVVVTSPLFQRGAALDVIGGRLYVTALSGEVSVINTASDTVSALLSVPNEPVQVALNLLTKTAYVSAQGGDVALIDTTNNHLIGVIPLVGGGEPQDVAVDPFLNRIYVAAMVLGNTEAVVWPIDGKTNTTLPAIPVSLANTGRLVINPFRRRVYTSVACENDTPQTCLNRISVIDENSNTIVENIPVAGGSPFQLGIDPLRDVLYACVLDKSTYSLTAINLRNRKQLATVPFPSAGALCAGIAVNTLTNRIYATDAASNTLVVFGGPKVTRRPHDKWEDMLYPLAPKVQM